MTAAISAFGSIEVIANFRARPGITHVLFDFDGTLSLIREGWPDVMLPLFLELLPAREGETPVERRQLLLDDIMRLNGKQTIYQMIQLAERIRERGGTPKDPLDYKREYLLRLDERIEWRRQKIRSGAAAPDEFLLHGSRALLDLLAERKLNLYLASGTDEQYVRQEVELLGLAHYFGRNIYGAQDDYQNFSKLKVIQRILNENRIDGDRLLAFGDGYVEIENSKTCGGLGIAVASDEANNGSGKVDPWKRERLLGVGADAVIPDYRDAPLLLSLIFGA